MHGELENTLEHQLPSQIIRIITLFRNISGLHGSSVALRGPMTNSTNSRIREPQGEQNRIGNIDRYIQSLYKSGFIVCMFIIILGVIQRQANMEFGILPTADSSENIYFSLMKLPRQETNFVTYNNFITSTI